MYYASLGNADGASADLVPVDPLERDREKAIRTVLGDDYATHTLYERLKNAEIAHDAVVIFAGDGASGTPTRVSDTGGYMDMNSPNRFGSAWIPAGFAASFCRAGNTWCSVTHHGPKFVFGTEIHKELVTHKAKGKEWTKNQVLLVRDSRTLEQKRAATDTRITDDLLREAERQTWAAEQLAALNKRLETTGVNKQLAARQIEQAKREAAAEAEAERVQALSTQSTQQTLTANQMAFEQHLMAQQQAQTQARKRSRYVKLGAAAAVVLVAAFAVSQRRRR